MSTGAPRRLGVRHHKLRAPRKHGLSVSVEEMWSRLSAAIAQIQHHNISKLSYEEHYRYAYNLILNQQGDMLYQGVQLQIQEHLVNQSDMRLTPVFSLSIEEAQAASQAMSGSDKGKLRDNTARLLGLLPGNAEALFPTIPAGERFLSAVTAMWDDHCSCMSKIRDVLKYVDRVYVPNHRREPIWDLGLDLFRDTVVRSTRVPCRTNLLVAMLRQVYCEREGATVERRTIKAVTDMLLSLLHDAKQSVYTHDFEPIFLSTTSEYYATEATRLLESQRATYYLQSAERRFAEEQARVDACLSPNTLAPLKEIVERRLLTEHLDEILAMPDGGLVVLLDTDARADMERMYRLFRLVPTGLDALNKVLRAYVTDRGKIINETTLCESKNTQTPSAEMAMSWVNQVLDTKSRLDGVLATSFQGDKSCEAAINEAMDTFINLNTRAPEFISLYIDEHLRKGTRVADDTTALEPVLNKTITIFRYVHEKDVFERYYKMHLTRRLLHNRSASDDAERSMIAKLKVECGHGYVQKLQGMLNDMKLSEEVLRAFHHTLEREGTSLPLQLNVNVLTATYWPIASPKEPSIFPPALTEACNAFEKFYDTRHRGRVLTWQPSLGTADVRVQFKSRTHELVVSTYALMVLLLFEHADVLTYGHIRDATRMPDADLQRTLQSLACAKYKILRKEPKGRDVSETDSFVFNADFTCSLARVKIAQVAAKIETPQERQETNVKIEEERKNQVEACIVRIMKSRKTLAHNELVNEVVQQLMQRFQPSPALIKKRIESLLDRGTSRYLTNVLQNILRYACSFLRN